MYFMNIYFNKVILLMENLKRKNNFNFENLNKKQVLNFQNKRKLNNQNNENKIKLNCENNQNKKIKLNEKNWMIWYIK